MSAWRLLVDPPQPGARNMAVDHALLESVRAGAPPALRLYRWQPACLSFGRNQHTRGIYDPLRLSDVGIDAVRRPTGGLAVLHDRELTYCVAASAGLLGGPRAAYRQINRALVAGLRRLGVPAAVAGGGATPHPVRDAAAPCFRAPAEGEVVAAGRKLVGSAQRAEHGTILQHGSILVDGSQAAVLDFLLDDARITTPAARAGFLNAAASPAAGGSPLAAGSPAAGGVPLIPAVLPAAGSATLHELLGRAPGWDELIAAVAEGFREACGICLAPGTLTAEEEARATVLADHYGGAAWTWRH